DFQRFACGSLQQAELIPHPAILAALGAKPIFVTVLARRKYHVKSSDDAIRVFGMQPVNPEAIVLQEIIGFVSPQSAHAVTDERGRKIAFRLAGMDDYRDGANQEFQALQMTGGATTDLLSEGGQRVIHSLRCLPVLEAQLSMKPLAGSAAGSLRHTPSIG